MSDNSINPEIAQQAFQQAVNNLQNQVQQSPQSADNLFQTFNEIDENDDGTFSRQEIDDFMNSWGSLDETQKANDSHKEAKDVMYEYTKALQEMSEAYQNDEVADLGLDALNETYSAFIENAGEDGDPSSISAKDFDIDDDFDTEQTDFEAQNAQAEGKEINLAYNSDDSASEVYHKTNSYLRHITERSYQNASDVAIIGALTGQDIPEPTAENAQALKEFGITYNEDGTLTFSDEIESYLKELADENSAKLSKFSGSGISSNSSAREILDSFAVLTTIGSQEDNTINIKLQSAKGSENKAQRAQVNGTIDLDKFTPDAHSAVSSGDYSNAMEDIALELADTFKIDVTNADESDFSDDFKSLLSQIVKQNSDAFETYSIIKGEEAITPESSTADILQTMVKMACDGLSTDDILKTKFTPPDKTSTETQNAQSAQSAQEVEPTQQVGATQPETPEETAPAEEQTVIQADTRDLTNEEKSAIEIQAKGDAVLQAKKQEFEEGLKELEEAYRAQGMSESEISVRLESEKINADKDYEAFEADYIKQHPEYEQADKLTSEMNEYAYRQYELFMEEKDSQWLENHNEIPVAPPKLEDFKGDESEYQALVDEYSEYETFMTDAMQDFIENTTAGKIFSYYDEQIELAQKELNSVAGENSLGQTEEEPQEIEEQPQQPKTPEEPAQEAKTIEQTTQAYESAKAKYERMKNDSYRTNAVSEKDLDKAYQELMQAVADDFNLRFEQVENKDDIKYSEIQTRPDGTQYTTIELPDGTVAEYIPSQDGWVLDPLNYHPSIAENEAVIPEEEPDKQVVIGEEPDKQVVAQEKPKDKILSSKQKTETATDEFITGDVAEDEELFEDIPPTDMSGNGATAGTTDLLYEEFEQEQEPAPAVSEEPAPVETEQPAPAVAQEPAPAVTEEPAPAKEERLLQSQNYDEAKAEFDKMLRGGVPYSVLNQAYQELQELEQANETKEPETEAESSARVVDEATQKVYDDYMVNPKRATLKVDSLNGSQLAILFDMLDEAKKSGMIPKALDFKGYDITKIQISIDRMVMSYIDGELSKEELDKAVGQLKTLDENRLKSDTGIEDYYNWWKDRKISLNTK